MKEFDPTARGQREQLRAERTARGDPALPPADEWCVVGYRLDVAGFAEGAAEAWREALRIDDGIPRAHFGLGHALLDLGDGPAAAASFRAAAEASRVAADRGREPLLDDPDEDPWYGVGLAEHLAGQPEEALEAYARTVEKYPYFPEPMLEMARCHLARGDRAAAAAAARRAIETAPHRPEFRADCEAVLRDAMP